MLLYSKLWYCIFSSFFFRKGLRKLDFGGCFICVTWAVTYPRKAQCLWFLLSCLTTVLILYFTKQSPLGSLCLGDCIFAGGVLSEQVFFHVRNAPQLQCNPCGCLHSNTRCHCCSLSGSVYICTHKFVCIGIYKLHFLNWKTDGFFPPFLIHSALFCKLQTGIFELRLPSLILLPLQMSH